MPFPFAAIPAIIGAVGTAVATVASVALAAAPYVLVGAAVLGGLAITGEIMEENERKRAAAQKAAEDAASRENERRKVEEKKRLEAEMENIKNKYGSNVPKEEQKKILLQSSEILGGLEGNRMGLEKQGQAASAEAIQAEKELKELQEQIGLKK